ncbi:MAG: restriction endonuclease [Rhodoplanes sp.]
MAVPDYQTLMLPLLRSAAAKEGETHIGALVDEIAGEQKLSDGDLSALVPSGSQSLLMNRLHWAKTYMQRAGLLESTRHGYFRVTERGRKLLNEGLKRIDNGVLVKFPEFVEWRSRSTVPETTKQSEQPETDEGTPEDQIAYGYTKINEALTADLIDRVHAAPPVFFERLIVDLLVAMGYGGGRSEAGTALGKSGDGGVDGVINEDALGLDVVYVQAKRYSPTTPVPVREVRDFVGSLEGFRASKGVFVTTSTFPAGAIEFAQRVSKRIVLIEGKELARLMVKHNIGVRVKNAYEIKAVDEEYFSE